MTEDPKIPKQLAGMGEPADRGDNVRVALVDGVVVLSFLGGGRVDHFTMTPEGARILAAALTEVAGSGLN